MISKQQIEDLIKNGKHFCIYPWIHLHVTGLGNLAPCCLSFSEGYGSLDTNSFEELWQSQSVRDFRLKMLNDEMVSDCFPCYDWERSGIVSFRQEANKRFKKYIDWVANTDADGYAPEAKPISWDIRFSNKCNLRCRICCSINSVAWVKEENELFNKNMYKQSGAFLKQMDSNYIIGIKDSQRLLSDLNEYLPNTDHIYCAGGEPLLIDECLDIMKNLDLVGNHDLKLEFNTNLTQLEKNINYLDYWKKFKNLKVIVSLDGSHERGEYIRKGIKWDSIINNLELLKRECPHAEIIINFTANIFNILHLPDFHQEMIEKQYINADQINLNTLFDPVIYSSKVLPEDLKKIATSKLTDHIVWIKGQFPFNKPENDQYYKDFIKQWHSCISFMNSEDCTDLIPEFMDYTNFLDESRNESFLDVFPDLESLVNLK